MNAALPPMVEAVGVGKRYQLGDAGLFQRRNVPNAAMLGARAGDEPGTFWCLRDVSFTVKRGDVVGLLGRNGAGKSTLLKILSRITEPTRGRITLRGRVASLLEVGTGFHPELTGRENIFLNGAILGMKRAEIGAKFDEIVQFAEVGAFLDTPVKRYSSGMFVRLAFAVAAHLEPEILLIDEVLAVGDAAFQKKCLGKMDEVAHQHGRTVFFVSHNLGAVRALCNTAILLQDGTVTMQGAPNEVIARYLASSMPDEAGGHVAWPEDGTAPGGDEVRLRSITLSDERGERATFFEAGQAITVDLRYRVLKRVRGARFEIFLHTLEGEMAFGATDHLRQSELLEPGEYRTVFAIPGGLLNRRGYVISACGDVPGERYIVPLQEYLTFTVGGEGNQASLFPEPWPGVTCPRVECKVERVT
jgi:lipopolysaccharide transport system ATP-binding protein